MKNYRHKKMCWIDGYDASHEESYENFTVYDYTPYSARTSDHMNRINQTSHTTPIVVTLFPVSRHNRCSNVQYFSCAEMQGWNMEDDDAYIMKFMEYCCETLFGIKNDSQFPATSMSHFNINTIDRVSDLIDVWNIMNPNFIDIISGNYYSIYEGHIIKQYEVCITILTDMLMSSGVDVIPSTLNGLQQTDVTVNNYRSRFCIDDDYMPVYGDVYSSIHTGRHTIINTFIQENKDKVKGELLRTCVYDFLWESNITNVNMVDVSALNRVAHDVIYRNNGIKDKNAAIELFCGNLNLTGGCFYLKQLVDGADNRTILHTITNGMSYDDDSFNANNAIQFAFVSTFIDGYDHANMWKFHRDHMSSDAAWYDADIDEYTAICLYISWLIRKHDGSSERSKTIPESSTPKEFIYAVGCSLQEVLGFEKTQTLSKMSMEHIAKVYDAIIDKHGSNQSRATVIGYMTRDEFVYKFTRVMNIILNNPTRVVDLF